MPKRGEKQSEEAKRKIKEASLKRYAKRSERQKISDGRRAAILAELRERTEEPQSKRCSLCRKTKCIDLFYTRRIKLKSGALVQRADSWCKDCTRARQKKYRAKEKRSWAQYRAGLKGHRLERYLEKQRARSAAYRRKNGAPERGARIPPKQTPWGGRISVEPLALFLESLEDDGARKLSRRCGVDERRITSILGRETRTISLRVADAILVGLGYAEELNTLYPSKQPRSGYRVIDVPDQ